MDDTNVEEESSDAAAYGLVALCDQTFDEVNNQYTEEVVATSGQILAAEIDEDSSVKIFVQHHVSADYNEQNNAECIVKAEEGNVINEQQDVMAEEYEASAPQEVSNEVVSLNNMTEEDKEAAGYMLAALHEVDIENVGSNDEVEVTEADIVMEGNFQEGEIDDENEDAKIIVSYAGDILDESYVQVLKSRQALMREAVEWKVYARMLLEKGCSEGANFYEPEVLTVLKATDDVATKAEILARITEKDMLQPAVQFWDFEKVYLCFGEGKSLNCPSCSMPLVFVPFGQRFALRMLYDIDRPVLLVTSFLRCASKGKKQHEILGYDPRLLRMFPNLDLPFMLFHKAGITKKMMEFIMNNIINGMTVNRLFDVVKTKYEVNHTISSQFFANEIDSIRAHVAAEGGQIEISAEAMFPPYVNCHPSKALLGRCFLASFKEKDDYYKFCMQQLRANECIILDDSLCVGARIGLPGVWGSAMKLFPEEFQGMFLVFNEAKHVLTWTFLKEDKFLEVQNTLSELRDRHTKSGMSLKACFTTKCCAWRDDLRKVFGKWFIVKGNLRLFLDRIIKEMPPDHTYYKDCVKELTLVFRGPNDIGDIRTEYTADPLVISQNLGEFIKRWRDVIDDRIQAVLTEKVMELLDELEQHVQAGCLSAIPPEVGDENFNDIHNALRKSVSHCRITVPLVSALFSMCLHDINRNRGAQVEFQYKPILDDVIGSFGNVKATEPPEGMSTVSVQTENSEKLQYQYLQPLMVEKQKILPAANMIQIIYNYYKVTGKDIPSLLLQALMYYKFQEDFDAFAPQAIQNLRLLPYYSSALNLISHPAFPKEQKVFDTKLIVEGLSEIEQKIRRLHVDGQSCTRLAGTASDIFTILARQLLKDKMTDNLSVEALEYIKQLMLVNIHVLEMKDRDLIQSLKSLVDFKDGTLDDVKKELVKDAGKTLGQQTIKQSESVIVVDKSNNISIMEVDKADMADKGSFIEDNALVFSTEEGQQLEEMKRTTESETASKIGETANMGDVDMIDVTTTLDTVKTSGSEQSTDNHADVVHVEHNSNHDNQKINSSPGKESDNVRNINVANVTDAAVKSDVTEKSDEDASSVGNEDFDLLKKLADKLGAVITVITNLEHCWIIPIFPESFNLFSPHFFIAYRFQRFFPAWLGNRASVSSIRNINLKRQGKEPQCRCGRGTPGRDGQGKCVSRENGKYLTRCICFRLDRPCTILCDCRNCENPFGCRPNKIRPKKPKIPYRQRYAHEAAKIATCKSSSVSSTIATQTPSGPEILDVDSGMESWVSLEHCIFEALINEIKSDDNVITPSEVQDTFNTVVMELLEIGDLGGVAYTKTLDQITLKLQQRERDVSEYLKIYQMQVDLSLG